MVHHFGSITIPALCRDRRDGEVGVSGGSCVYCAKGAEVSDSELECPVERRGGFALLALSHVALER